MSARHPRVALALVITEGFLGRLTFGMVSFGLPLYALSLGLSLGQIGVVIGVRTVAAVLLKPLAGWLADKVGVRAVYLGGTIARAGAAAALLVVGDFTGLCAVRVLQGASAAGRDIASLSVIARDASDRIGSVYSWYATAKHVGGVAGAGLAGGVLAVTDGSFQTLFVIVLSLSVLPISAAWLALREATAVEPRRHPLDAEDAATNSASGWAAIRELVGELRAPASLGMLVATSAYMVHGLFPVLATDYAGLSAGQTGAIYSLSALVFVIAGPAFGWIVDRHGHAVGTAWRSMANIGSSVLFIASPNMAGFALARTLDDSGKAAFRPAWASLIGGVANSDPKRRNRTLAVLDTSETVGEAIGPVLAGILWQTGGITVLFGARIVIAAMAEVMALRLTRLEGRVRSHEAGEAVMATSAHDGASSRPERERSSRESVLTRGTARSNR